jgi:acetyl esterase/lipase
MTTSNSIYHPITDADAAAMAAMREFLKTVPGIELTPAARPFFDEMTSQVPQAPGVEYQSDVLGGLTGWWCRVQGASPDAAILYLHGGGYILGSATAYRNTVGQIAAAAASNAFVVEYSLAPEKTFPAAFDDAVAVYDALVHQGIKRLAVVGDSAGGGLALAVLAYVSKQRDMKPVAAVAISPWSDMTASGMSMDSRAANDPFLNRKKLLDAADLYLAGADAQDQRASPLFGHLDGLPPTLIHVGEDEVLLDDAVRYAERAEEAGSSVELHVWAEMVHVFTSSIETLEAAREALKGIGNFLARNLGSR